MGFEFTTLQEGDGTNFPERGQTVRISFSGYFIDGTKFDSTADRGQPTSFRVGLGQVVRGVDEAVGRMSIGQKIRLSLPPEYAYGRRGLGNIIPPNATLNFEIELLGFN